MRAGCDRPAPLPLIAPDLFSQLFSKPDALSKMLELDLIKVPDQLHCVSGVGVIAHEIDDELSLPRDQNLAR